MLKKTASCFNRFINVFHAEKSVEFKVNSFWLRDHCRCKECYNEKTHQITSNVLKIPPTIHPLKIKQHGDVLNVLWDDQHASEYSIPYLYSVILPQKKYKPLFWNKNLLQANLTKPIAHNEISSNKTDGCRELLKSVLTLGLGLVNGVEATASATEKLIDCVAPQMDSIFGKTSVVSSDYMKHEDFAYTNVGLEAHNDNTYWNDAAGLETFHILFHDGEGGETRLVDGFYAASKLKEKEPEAFEILCKVPVPAEYVDKNCHYTAVDSVLKVNPISGELLQIRYNIRDRAVFNTIPQSDVGLFYEAYRLLGEEINKEENQFLIKLQPGTVLFIDNWRVLHGRTAFTGTRKFCSCYISKRDWMNTAKMLNLF